MEKLPTCGQSLRGGANESFFSGKTQESVDLNFVEINQPKDCLFGVQNASISPLRFYQPFTGGDSLSLSIFLFNKDRSTIQF